MGSQPRARRGTSTTNMLQQMVVQSLARSTKRGEKHKITRIRANCTQTCIYISIEWLPSTRTCISISSEWLPSTRKGVSVQGEWVGSARKGISLRLGARSRTRSSIHLRVDAVPSARRKNAKSAARVGARERAFACHADRFRALGRDPIRLSMGNRVLGTHSPWMERVSRVLRRPSISFFCRHRVLATRSTDLFFDHLARKHCSIGRRIHARARRGPSTRLQIHVQALRSHPTHIAMGANGWSRAPAG
jgi:hypothetical protein